MESKEAKRPRDNAKSDADRAGGDVGDGGGGQKKKKYARNGGGDDANRPPKVRLPGILCTCDTMRERSAAAEALDLFTEYLDKLYPLEGSSEASAASGDGGATAARGGAPSMQDLIRQETEALKKPGRGRRLNIKELQCKGLVMVSMTEEQHDPDQVVSAVMRDILRSGMSRCRHLIRLMPLQKTCYASIEELETIATPLIEKHFGAAAAADGPDADGALAAQTADDAAPAKKQYAVLLKRRHNTDFPKDDAIAMLARLVGPRHKVNISHPETVIMVEIFKATCGVSIIDGYNELAKYNVRSGATDGDAKAAAGGGKAAAPAKAKKPAAPTKSDERGGAEKAQKETTEKKEETAETTENETEASGGGAREGGGAAEEAAPEAEGEVAGGR